METGLLQEPHCGPGAQRVRLTRAARLLLLVRGCLGAAVRAGKLTHSAWSCRQLRWLLDKLVHVLH